MTKSYTKIIPVLALLFLMVGITSCTKVVRTSEFAQVIDYPEDAHPAPVKFSKLKTQLSVGTDVGVYRPSCLWFGVNVGRDFFRRVHMSDLDDRFAETLEAQGYDIVDQLNSVFDEEYEDDLLRSEYSVSGKIIDADINVCGNNTAAILGDFLGDHFYGTYGQRGKVFMKIEWGVYDNLRRTVVYKATTEGYVDRKAPNVEGLTLMIHEAFSMAVHNLGADQAFHDLIFSGKKPQRDWSQKKKAENRPRVFDAKESVIIANPPLSSRPLTDHVDYSREVAVLVQGGAGHGSGYFISHQGHIITNKHVVGNAQRVRVVTADKEETLIAEVLRKSSQRDVALLKLESVPDDLEIVTLPIKTEWPKVSADIYALGAPSHKRMQDTLSKGIVSAHRRNFQVFGAKMNFIQGDVQTIGGNSGGPLLDVNGNIVGMSVAGLYNKIGESDSGLNLFIPIEDALKHLDITLHDRQPLGLLTSPMQ